MFSNVYTVRYSETGENLKATFPAIVSYFQDTSISHSASVGQGVNFLLEKGLAWLLAGWHIEVVRYPALGEKLFLKTCSTGFKSMYGYRIFTMEDENGNVIAKASSVWIYYNFKDKKFKKVGEDEERAFASENVTVFEDDRTYKINKCDSYSFHSDTIVKKTDIDTNCHANNISYIKYIVDAFPEINIYDLRIQYKKQAMHKDKVKIYYNFNGDKRKFLLTDENEEIFAVAESNK